MTSKASVMFAQDSLQASPIRPMAGGLAAFADPEWRGCVDDLNEQALRPLIHIQFQVERLAAWISGGTDYGWLGAYQARRAAFELQSIRAQISHELAQNDGRLPDDDRRAVQSRLDRLEICLEAVRGQARSG